MIIRENPPTSEYVDSLFHKTRRPLRAATLEEDGQQIVYQETYCLDEVGHDLLKACFRAVRRDYEFLGKPRIAGWAVMPPQESQRGAGYLCAVKLYLESHERRIKKPL